MKTTKILLLLIVFSPLFLKAQNVLDGAYPRENMVLRKPMPYQEIREADAMYSKKIMRYLDLSEKRNHPLYFPTQEINYPVYEGQQPDRARVSLYSLIKLTAASDKVKYPLFDFTGNESLYMTRWWANQMSDTVIDNLGWLPCTEEIWDTLDQRFVQVTINRCFKMEPRDVKGFFIWEEWVFDKQRSVMDVRIVAMQPVVIVSVDMEAKSKGSVKAGQMMQLFWLYYPHFRDSFQTHEVVSSNEAVRLSFDDIFAKRLFSSIIVAEANPYDNRKIEDYLMGIEAIREGERIQGVLADYEHDQWEY